MHTVRFLLDTTEYDCHVLEKRFHAAAHIHNVLVKHAKKLLKRLSFDKDYQSLRAEYSALLKKPRLSREEKAYKEQLSTKLKDTIRSYGLSEYAFQSYIKVCGKQFRKCLSSQQVQKEASRVWAGVGKVLYGNGRDVHFKKYRGLTTVSGKTNTNGAKFDKGTYTVEWLGLTFKCRIPRDNAYATESLDADISYCEIERKMFPNGWHYYVVVYLKGDAPKKLKDTGSAGNVTGVDIGVSTVAAVSADKATLQELAPRCRDYNKRIKELLRYMDTSKRLSNPKKYKPDGTVDKSNHDKWVFSKAYLKARNKLGSLYRQRSAYIKQSHEEMINILLEDSVDYIVEDMSFKGLQRRSKTTERQDKASSIVQKDGSARQVYKYKRKKRFGRSLNNRAPARFIAILERKAALYGGCVYKVNTKEFRASQYDHVSDSYRKQCLGCRDKMVGGHRVQRDLYSAFLLRNSNAGLDKPDRDKCIYGFDIFLVLQDSLITGMMENNISMKQCFGF